MKKIFFLLFIFSGFHSSGQNNLQFSKVILIEADTTYSCSTTCEDYLLQRNIDVPLGKVLKIESINFGRFFSYTTDFYMNSVKIASVGTYDKPITLPIWLPTGTYSLKLRIAVNSGDYDFSYQLSGIEFNIVP